MDSSLKRQFFGTLMRFKRTSASFPIECEVQMNELMILEIISKGCSCSERDFNVSRIQENLHITKPAVSQILNSLEKKGYIVREINAQDRRKISVMTTPAGDRALLESMNLYDEMLSELFSRFGEENIFLLINQLDELTRVFQQLKDEYHC
ncbi:MarR family winged helix-turn-helix transcriptional regulator [Novisyntrophococcus fermenticellae]|uniref:MarR family winged helix-turn-helix transcriptional regulator n=1 Tax=Novisyntrophococcus fermenticellae TaxID=2068655 RepID=UPI001E39282E|nr:MarR family winged helix-turn-helix transcriptional regulator [Novisyntrophococcus fermenticellae]